MAKIKKEKTLAESTGDFLGELCTLVANPYASIAFDGITSGDVTGFIPTGSFLLNGLLSGTLFGGIPANKITAFAGEESTGKTFLVLDIVRNFLLERDNGVVIYFESESAVSKSMLEERNIDTKRVLVIPIDTVQNFRTQILKIIDKYLAIPVPERKPMIFVLDSLGMLSTTKEIEDTAAGKETSDMTRAKLIKSTFRTITLKLGIAGLPLIVTNHTYEEQGMFAKKVMCLTGDTLVKVNGVGVPIKDISVGTRVDTMVGPQEVTEIFEYPNSQVYSVVLDTGYTIKCTEDHRFLTGFDEKCWDNDLTNICWTGDDVEWESVKSLMNRLQTAQLHNDDEDEEDKGVYVITCINNNRKRPIFGDRQIKSITAIPELETVYDITVRGANSGSRPGASHYIIDIEFCPAAASYGIISHNSGGSGTKYSASTIVFLSKRKDKVGTDVVGNIITCKLQKARLTKENSVAHVLLNYATGMHPYYGLLELGEKYGIINRIGNKYDFGDGTKHFVKAIMSNPENHFTEGIMIALDEVVKKEYCYGTSSEESSVDSDVEDVEFSENEEE